MKNLDMASRRSVEGLTEEGAHSGRIASLSIDAHSVSNLDMGSAHVERRWQNAIVTTTIHTTTWTRTRTILGHKSKSDNHK